MIADIIKQIKAIGSQDDVKSAMNEIIEPCLAYANQKINSVIIQPSYRYNEGQNFAIATGKDYTVLLIGNTLYSCGYNIVGQLGNGNNLHTSNTTFTKIIGFIQDRINAIACGSYHTIVLIENIPPTDLPKTCISLLAIRLAAGRDIPEKIVGTSIIKKQNRNSRTKKAGKFSG
jgi:hypothetical protein